MIDDERVGTWEAEAATFDDEPDHGLADPTIRSAWRDLLLSVLPPAPARVADLGCGTGTLSLLLAEVGYDLTGVDFSPAMLTRARIKAPGSAFLLGDVGKPPLSPASYDVVLARHVLWAVPEPAAALARWVKLLAPGGVLVLVEGRWSTGAGLSTRACRDLVRTARSSVAVTMLPEAVYWGRSIDDERYLVLSGR